MGYVSRGFRVVPDLSPSSGLCFGIGLRSCGSRRRLYAIAASAAWSVPAACAMGKLRSPHPFLRLAPQALCDRRLRGLECSCGIRGRQIAIAASVPAACAVGCVSHALRVAPDRGDRSIGSVAQFWALFWFWVAFLRLAPQALCDRRLRGLYLSRRGEASIFCIAQVRRSAGQGDQFAALKPICSRSCGGRI